MDGFATSTITALLYARTPSPSVEELAGELVPTLGVEPETCFHGHYTCLLFELPDRRIALIESATPAASSADPAGPRALFVVVGDMPGTPKSGHDHLGLCEALAQRIELRHPADGMVLAEVDGLMTPADIDCVASTVLMEYDAGATPEEPDRAPQADDTPASRRKHRVGLLDTFQPQALSPTLAERFDREVADREARLEKDRMPWENRQTPGPILFPTTTYGEPRPAPPPRSKRALKAFALLRKQPPREDDDALFPSSETARARPLVHRAAIQALNVTMVAFSLPMGAFLMTLALLGRESFAMSARMTAATGAGIGIAQDPGVAHFVTGLF